MMKLISNLPIYLRYSACLLIFVAFTACGDDEAATGETTPTAETLAAPGSSCSCDADCASFGSNTGVCLDTICMTESDPVDTCPNEPTVTYEEGTYEEDTYEEGTDTNCPTGFQCWFGICWPDCDAFSCDGTCDSDGSCVRGSDAAACDSTCSRYCTTAG